MAVRTHSRSRRVAAGAALALALLAGCSGTADAPPPVSAEPAGSAAPARPAAPSAGLAASAPTRLLIPAIGVDTRPVIDLGLTTDGALEVPPDGASAGWYTGAPTPGEVGPAVFAAHVDWKGEKGVFYDLRTLQPGDEVTVERADGTAVAFAVRRVEQYAKDRFPTAEVYGDVATPQLRLITCGGEFDRSLHSYRDNVVVFAEMVGLRSA
jgi:Sortase domain